jgi:hypothetical protein
MVALTHVKMAGRTYMYRYVGMACQIYDEMAGQTQAETVAGIYVEMAGWTHIEPHVWMADEGCWVCTTWSLNVASASHRTHILSVL